MGLVCMHQLYPKQPPLPNRFLNMTINSKQAPLLNRCYYNKKKIQNGHQYLTMLLQLKKQIQNGHQFDHATSITKQIEYSRHYRSILLRSQKQIQNGHHGIGPYAFSITRTNSKQSPLSDHATSITKQFEYSRHYWTILLRSQKQIRNGRQYRTKCFFNYNKKLKMAAISRTCRFYPKQQIQNNHH